MKTLKKLFKDKKLLKDKKKILLLFFLFCFALFLRVYRLEDLMVYLGDEGRDMLIIMDILQGKNFPFIGPPTSIGNLYLGPIYYYFITPFAWLFKMNPIGPAIFVAILGALTVILVYQIGKEFFNKETGWFAALLYTVSPFIIKFSRSSWNPNPMPFFTLGMLLSLFYWQKTKKAKFVYFTFICFAVMLQLHYMVIMLTPLLIYLVYQFVKKVKNKKPLIFAFLIFIILLSPLVFFDLKHNFVNLRGISTIFQVRASDGFSLSDLTSRTRDRLRQLFSLFLGFSEREWRTNLVVISALIFAVYDWLKQKKVTRLIIYGYFIWGMLSIGIYKGSFYPHYLGFLYPVPAIYLGLVLGTIFKSKRIKFSKLLSIFLFVLLSFNMVKITYLDLSRPAVLNVNLIQKIVRLIDKESNGEEFNFSLLAKHNYDSSYRFFFKLWQIPAVYEKDATNQLFVVCEDLDICQPEGNAKWEIAVFDAAYNGEIERQGEWQPDPLIKVIRFVPKNK